MIYAVSCLFKRLDSSDSEPLPLRDGQGSVSINPLSSPLPPPNLPIAVFFRSYFCGWSSYWSFTSFTTCNSWCLTWLRFTQYPPSPCHLPQISPPPCPSSPGQPLTSHPPPLPNPPCPQTKFLLHHVSFHHVVLHHVFLHHVLLPDSMCPTMSSTTMSSTTM